MSKKSKMFIKTGLLLLTAALFITIYNIFSDISGKRASNAALGDICVQIEEAQTKNTEVINSVKHELENKGKDEAVAESYVTPDYVLDPDREMPVINVDGNEYIGTVSIPSIELELPVISHWSYPNLKIAPCRYAGSVYSGDMVIAAHNYQSHFGRLKDLSYGDELSFTDAEGNIFTYEVTDVETLQPLQTEDMITGDWDLTLFTCTVGGRTRVTVRCELIGTQQSGMTE